MTKIQKEIQLYHNKTIGIYKNHANVSTGFRFCKTVLFFKPKCSSVQKHRYISVSKNCTANWATHKKMDSGNKNFFQRLQPDEINTDFQL